MSPAISAPAPPRALGLLTQGTLGVATALILLKTALIVAQVVARNVWNMGLPRAEEIARFSAVLAVHFAAPVLALRGQYVAVDVFINLMPRLPRSVCFGLPELSGLAFSALTIWGGWLYLQRGWRFRTPALGMQNIWLFEPLLMCFALLAGIVIWCLWANSRQERALPSAVTILAHNLPASVLWQRAVNSIDSRPLLAVPMFSMAAALLGATGVTTCMFDLMRMVVGRMRGGMAHVNVLLSLVFSGMSGPALGDIGALGRMQVREMEKQGYTRRFAAAAEASPVKMLLAGIMRALWLAAMLMGYVALIARAQNLPRDDVAPSLPDFRRLSVISLPALMTPMLLIGGLPSGYFVPAEAEGITVAYAVRIGVLVYRKLTFGAVVGRARDTVLATGNILFVVAAAAVCAGMLSISDNPLVLLLFLNLVLLVAGMLLDSIVAILFTAPIVTPAATLRSAWAARKGLTGPRGVFRVVIDYPEDNAGVNQPTLAPVVAGNLFDLGEVTGLKLSVVALTPGYHARYDLPALGIGGTRASLGVQGRPIFGTIIKPDIGLSAQEIAALVVRLCDAGADFITDDEIAGTHPQSPADARIRAVMEVVRRYSDRTGRLVVVAFNITDETDAMRRHADLVLAEGGSCAMVSLNRVGMAAVQTLRRHTPLAIHGHPNGYGAMGRHPLLDIGVRAYQGLHRLAGIDHMHVHGMGASFPTSTRM